MLPLDLLRIPLFSLSVCVAICAYAAQILAYVSLPFLFQAVMHRTAVATGLLVTPWPVLVACAAPVAGRLSARYPCVPAGQPGAGDADRGAADARGDAALAGGLECGVADGPVRGRVRLLPDAEQPHDHDRPGRRSGTVRRVPCSRWRGRSAGRWVSALVALIFAIAGSAGAVTLPADRGGIRRDGGGDQRVAGGGAAGQVRVASDGRRARLGPGGYGHATRERNETRTEHGRRTTCPATGWVPRPSCRASCAAARIARRRCGR